MRFAALIVLVGFVPAQAQPAPSREGIEYFEKHVRPVFVEHCVACHGPKKQTASLRLDSKAGILKGGDGGPVLVAGSPEKSMLIQAIRHSGELKMPPKVKLPANVVEQIAEWVKQGAPLPDDAVSMPDPGKSHWAFQQVKPVAVPNTKSAAQHPIDRFVNAKLEAVGGAMAKPADRRTLIRRVTHDLTGLLPTPEEVDTFMADTRSDAFDRLVDRLLSSPAYGEHQARHWMDLARYSDTKGYVFTEDRNYPFAYTYRDWLIRSFNEDMPYDRFIRLQLAADRLNPPDRRDLAAMGFLTVGRRFLNNIHDIIDDRLDVTFRTFQGLTIGCARCHDHKYDPIPARDYYSLYGVFSSSQEPKEGLAIDDSANSPEFREYNAKLQSLENSVRESRQKLRADYRAKLTTPEAISAYIRAARDVRGNARELADERKLNVAVLNAWKAYLDGKKTVADLGPFFALGAIPDAEWAAKWSQVLSGKPAEAWPKPIVDAINAKKPTKFSDVCDVYAELILKPGDNKTLSAVLGSGGPIDFSDDAFDRVVNRKERDDLKKLIQKVDAFKASSPSTPPRAMALIDAKQPSQPVVFLRGNPNNRGPQVPRQFLEVIAGAGRKPFADGSGRREMADSIADAKNPLTSRVMVNRVWGHLFGEALVRTPSDFGVRTEPATHPELLDWLAHRFVEDGWSLKRLHRTIVTSSAYQQSADPVAGPTATDTENRLLGRMGRKRLTFESLRDSLLRTSGRLDPSVGGRSVDLFKAPFTQRRAVYGFIDRQNLPGTFRTFDVALPDTHSPQRFVTTVPQQALFLLNSPFVLEQAKALAGRLTSTEPGDRVNELYRLVYARKPSDVERTDAVAFAKEATGGAAWEQLAQVLLLSNEFAFID